MTVTYSAEVATSRGFGCFWKLLFRWRGSIYKLLWPDLCLYLSFYYFLSVLYRFALAEDQKRFFEKVSRYCSTYGDLIPVSFVLGFYVSLVVKRWWDSFDCIPWPDSLAFFVSAFIHGQDERGRLMRRTIMRYVNLAFVFTLTCISPCVKKRFPTMDHLVEAGILLPNEKKIIEQMKTTHSTYWMPLVWASSIATRARKEGRIRDDFALKTVIDAIAHYRSLCGGLFNYDWINIPLVYTQVVTLVVYTFFLATLMGRQYLDPIQGYQGYEVDLYIPIFNFLQFFFYMGWLKVAETLVNPFGEDDDDFEVNWVIDRDIQVSYLIVDEMHQEHPELIKDQYWDEVMPDLPYTAAAMPFYTEPPQGSAAALIVPAHEAEFVALDALIENPEEEQLEEVKVNFPNQPIPVTNDERNRLSRNLSESSHSSISAGFGRSFHPHSQQQRSVLSLLHRLFSRDNTNLAGSNISLQSSQSKMRKSNSKESNVCATPSSPPSPTDSRSQNLGFPDDIFHLSDLSLAESRATSGVQSPGAIFWNFQVPDLFNRLKAEHRNSAQMHRPPKPSSPRKGDSSDDDQSKTNMPLKKQRAQSLKRFFRTTGKLRSSQKSLIESYQLRRNSNSMTNADTESIISDVNFVEGEGGEVRSENGKLEPSAVTPELARKVNVESDEKTAGIPLKMSLKGKSASSLPCTPNSPNIEISCELLKRELSTHTLIASDDGQSTNSSNDVTEKFDPKNERDSADAETTKSDVVPTPSGKSFSNSCPKRAVSLLIHDKYSYGNRNVYNRRKQRSQEIISSGSAAHSPKRNLKARLVLKKDLFLKRINKNRQNENAVIPSNDSSSDRPDSTCPADSQRQSHHEQCSTDV